MPRWSMRQNPQRLNLSSLLLLKDIIIEHEVNVIPHDRPAWVCHGELKELVDLVALENDGGDEV